jgi:hypothetical protein
MKKFQKMLALSVSAAVVCTVLNMAVPQDASGQSSGVAICFRGQTVLVPSYLVSRYVAAGATPGPCQISGSL